MANAANDHEAYAMAIMTERVFAREEFDTLLLCSDIITPLAQADANLSGTCATWPHNALEQALKLATAHRRTRDLQSPTPDP